MERKHRKPTDDEQNDTAGEGPSRRDFLKGSGALASAGMMLQNPGVEDVDELFDNNADHVPDEPADGGQVRKFTVHAMEVDLVYNRFGLHQPNAAVYVLRENRKEARRASGKVPCGNNVVLDNEEPFCDDIPKHKRADNVDTRVLQPLTLRANRGDIIEIEFHNDLNRTASMHQTALPYDVETSDGMDVGFNPDTTVDPGESITYRWFADHLGAHFFLDGANQAFDSADAPPERANLTSRGLFGSMVVLPQRATWTDPFTGEEEQGHVQADIHVPEDIPQADIDEGSVPGVSFRQVLLHYHTPEGIVTAEGEQLTFPNSDEPQMVHAINYRADPTGSRLANVDDPEFGEHFYNSWLFGDPGGGDNVYPMYTGDPVKVTAVGGSIEENHVHHLHNHRWKRIPPEDESDTLDSQTVGLGAVYETPLVPAFGEPVGPINDFDTVRPNMEFDEAFQVGAGGAHQGTGDILFHCHLFPHYGEGMWGIMRILDKERKNLEKLPTNEPPIPADSNIPGFPEFIPGEFGEVPPFPPYGAAGLDQFRNPTPDEQQALTRKGEILPGAPYTDPCEPDIQTDFTGKTREYNIVALPANIVYNDAGHHDPNGLVFVLEEDEEKVKNGEMNPEPLVIRANVGDCVDITLRNEVTEERVAAVHGDHISGNSDAGAENVEVEAGGKSNHIHFVSYDVLGSDSLSTGFNYRQEAEPGEEMFFRWFADEEGTIFFHDHITGIEDVMHGTFASLIVEPRGSEWLDPHTGEPIRSGTQAIIQDPEENDFREFALLYQDFAQLVDRNGNFINPDEEHDENAGVMAINYRNTPYYIRNNADPAYVHSSFVHGDPSTPLLEAYEDDPVRIRLLQAAYEEQHNFEMNGREIDPEGLNPEEGVSQVIGTSEAFTFDILPETEATANQSGDHRKHTHDGHEHDDLLEPLNENPAGLPIRDYRYGSTIVDDLWDGMWGIHRVFGAQVDHLHPLPDQGAPDGKITETELKEMGHPAPFSDFDWATVGQKAKLLYDKYDDKRFPPDKNARQNRNIDGNPPPIAPRPGDPCLDDAPIQEFDISSFQTTINYNDYGDQDPHGTVFARDEHVEGIRNGQRELMPLTLFVNEGDCVQINLTNRLDPDRLDDDHAHPQMRTKEENLGIEWERSERISLHPTRIERNVLGSDGSTIGFNWDQTIGPGETITYRWLADEPIGSVILWDHADIRSNRHHGAYGQLIIEENGVEFADPRTAEPLLQGLTGDPMLKMPNGPDKREFALAFADAQHIVNPTTNVCVVPPGPEEDVDPNAPCNQIPDDPEDQGYPGINYRSEPFIRRFQRASDDQSQVYDSQTHGDPNTPIPRALLGDPVTFRINKVADKARGLSFHLSDHQWNRLRDIEASENVGVDDLFTVGRSDRVEPFGGAGGLAESTGDFIYQELKMRRRLEGGFWGIFRVRDSFEQFKHPMQPLPDHAKRMQLKPKDRPGWNVAKGDITGNGHTDMLIGVPHSDHGGTNAGAAYLFYGPIDGEITDLLDADLQMIGEHAHSRAGWHIDIEENLVIVDAKEHDTRYIMKGDKRPTGSISLADADVVIKPDEDC